MLETTKRADARLIAHRVYQSGDQVTARLTAYGDTTDQVERLVGEIEDSELTDVAKRINNYFDLSVRSYAAGNATQELLVEYKPRHSIHDAILSRGFVPEEEIRIEDGYEYWTVIISEPRSTIRERLDAVRGECNAEIRILGTKSPEPVTSMTESFSQLTERQRDVFELARREGYYTWPREVSAGDLAERMNISKTTLLEHLRKAEAKLLGTEN